MFLRNHLDFGATTIAAIYKERWQVELFFKAPVPPMKGSNPHRESSIQRDKEGVKRESSAKCSDGVRRGPDGPAQSVAARGAGSGEHVGDETPWLRRGRLGRARRIGK